MSPWVPGLGRLVWCIGMPWPESSSWHSSRGSQTAWRGLVVLGVGVPGRRRAVGGPLRPRRSAVWGRPGGDGLRRQAKGVYKGRRRRLSPEQVVELRQRAADGETRSKIARDSPSAGRLCNSTSARSRHTCSRMAANIDANLKAFLADRAPGARYASFDYCYNHFQEAREAGGSASSPTRSTGCCRAFSSGSTWRAGE